MKDQNGKELHVGDEVSLHLGSGHPAMNDFHITKTIKGKITSLDFCERCMEPEANVCVDGVTYFTGETGIEKLEPIGEHPTTSSPKTVGDLRKFLEGLPDDLPVVRMTRGYYQVHRNDVSLHSRKTTIILDSDGYDGFCEAERSEPCLEIFA